jgi:hypothetical protein
LETREGRIPSDAVPVARLRDQIREAVPRCEKWKTLLDRPARNKDVPALLDILRQRVDPPGMEGFAEEFIGGQVCKRLKDLNDRDALLKAACIQTDLRDLSGAFATRDGREFLLKKIRDDRDSLQERVAGANLLALQGEGSPDEGHLKQIAELAERPGQNEKLQIALLDSLSQLAVSGRFSETGTNADAKIQKGRKEAAGILAVLAGETDSEEVKYNIDLVLPAFGYKPFSSNNCLLQLDRYDAGTRKLYLRCRISGGRVRDRMPIAFVNTKTDQKWTTLSNYYFHGEGTESPGDVDLPGDLPKGHYKVFYEFMENGKVQSTSHYFEVDL